MTSFTFEEIREMKRIIHVDRSTPVLNPTTSDKEQIIHGFHQMWRFANLAHKGEEFRALQFGLNLGRTQELLGSIGGVDKWWRVFEPGKSVLSDGEKI